MIALVVKKCTEVKTIQDGLDWKWENIKSEVLAEDRMFFAEDIRIDPLGNVGCGPQNTNVVGGGWARWREAASRASASSGRATSAHWRSLSREALASAGRQSRM